MCPVTASTTVEVAPARVGHAAVAEGAVVDVTDDTNGHAICAFVMLRANYEDHDGTTQRAVRRDGLGISLHHPAEKGPHRAGTAQRHAAANHAPLAARRRLEPESWATGQLCSIPAVFDVIQAG